MPKKEDHLLVRKFSNKFQTSKGKPFGEASPPSRICLKYKPSGNFSVYEPIAKATLPATIPRATTGLNGL